MKVRIQDIPELGMELVVDAKSDAWWREAVHDVFAKSWKSGDLARAQVRLTRSDELVSVGADIDTTIHPQCDRCLIPFKRPYHLHFQHYLLPADSDPRRAKHGRDQELNEEDMEFGIYEGQIIQLGQILREQMVLELPYQYLCDPNCQGLCPHCGVNLNQKPCSCPDESHLSPFAGLKSLKS